MKCCFAVVANLTRNEMKSEEREATRGVTLRARYAESRSETTEIGGHYGEEHAEL